MTEYEKNFDVKRKSIKDFLKPLEVKFYNGVFSNKLGNYILDRYGSFQEFFDLLVYDITKFELRPDVIENRESVIWYKCIKKRAVPTDVYYKESLIRLEFDSLLNNFIFDRSLLNEFKGYLNNLYI